MNIISQKISLYKFNAICVLTKLLGTVTNFCRLIFFFFWLCHVACEIIPDQGLNLGPWQ